MKSFYRCAVVIALAAACCSSASAVPIYGIVDQGPQQLLVKFDSSAPTVLQDAKLLTALPSNDTTVLGIDFRPANGQLYAALRVPVIGGVEYRIANIDPATGNVQNSFTPSGASATGISHGFDFNPVIDRLRVVNDVNDNYVFNPTTRLLESIATDLFYGASDVNVGKDPNVAGSAYTNSLFQTPSSTQLYGIDTNLNILVTQANSAGTLGTVGPLNVDISALAGFDITGVTNQAFAVMTPAGSSQSNLYTINLASGAATSLGPIGGGLVLTSMAIPITIPEPATVAMSSFVLLGLAAARRRTA